MTSIAHHVIDFVGNLTNMCRNEPRAHDTDGARWFLMPDGTLFLYGTDPLDLRDWWDNLNGRRAPPTASGLHLADGGYNYAQKVLEGLAAYYPDRKVRMVYGHSLGAAAAFHVAAALATTVSIVVRCGCPRDVHADYSDKFEKLPFSVYDITNPRDPITQLVPWNKRLPGYAAQRIRLPGKWYQIGWKSGLALAVGAGCAVLIPVFGWIGLSGFLGLFFKMLIKEHHIPTYIAKLQKLKH